MPRLAAAVVLALLTAATAAGPVEERTSIGGLPAHASTALDEIAGCQLSPSGAYLVFDRRAHAVFRFARGADSPEKIVQIGSETGRILRPTAFDVAPDGTFAIADSPGNRRRVQLFTEAGSPAGGFVMEGSAVPFVTLGDVAVSGLGTLEYTGRSIFMSQPDTGALVTEYGLNGAPLRSIGELRPTGQEKDRAVHEALNVAIPVPTPDKGFFVVFVSGVPMFRKYDAAGTLLFERHVEGPEVDGYLRQMPGTWRTRRAGDGEIPLVPSMIRTAAADRDGNLWISLVAPVTYVYDASGEKRQTVRFRAAGIIAPTGFFFTRDARLLATPGCYAFPAGL